MLFVLYTGAMLLGLGLSVAAGAWSGGRSCVCDYEGWCDRCCAARREQAAKEHRLMVKRFPRARTLRR